MGALKSSCFGVRNKADHKRAAKYKHTQKEAHEHAPVRS